MSVLGRALHKIKNDLYVLLGWGGCVKASVRHNACLVLVNSKGIQLPSRQQLLARS